MQEIQCICDSFLSQFLDKPAYTFKVRSNLSIETIRQSVFQYTSNRSAFISVKIPGDKLSVVHSFEEAGFRLADINLALKKAIESNKQGALVNIRKAESRDENSVRQVARDSFSLSRFHMDPHISKNTADEIKAAWAGNYFSGQRGDFMYVAEVEGKVGGFLQLLTSEETLVVDLVAVSPDFRRHGLCQAMIAKAQKEYYGLQTILTGTQAINIPSLKMYESMGFRMFDSSYVLHLHV